MNALQLLFRREVLARLKAHGPLVALVPATSIYGQTTPPDPAWPFIRLGETQTLPFRASCLRGADLTAPISAFAKPRQSGGVIFETAEDHAGRIGAAIEGAIYLKGALIAPNGEKLRLRYDLSDIRLTRDGAEVDAFHWRATVRARAMAA